LAPNPLGPFTFVGLLVDLDGYHLVVLFLLEKIWYCSLLVHLIGIGVTLWPLHSVLVINDNYVCTNDFFKKIRIHVSPCTCDLHKVSKNFIGNRYIAQGKGK
jgi:hypothetical protein